MGEQIVRGNGRKSRIAVKEIFQAKIMKWKTSPCGPQIAPSIAMFQTGVNGLVVLRLVEALMEGMYSFLYIKSTVCLEFKVYTLEVSPILVSRYCEDYRFWSTWGPYNWTDSGHLQFWSEPSEILNLKVLKYSRNCSLNNTLIPWSLKNPESPNVQSNLLIRSIFIRKNWCQGTISRDQLPIYFIRIRNIWY